MQTFLPKSDFIHTARCLDDRRLGKQRVEAWQIINILEGMSSGWVTHPAVRMWNGCVSGLKVYYNEMLNEWAARGFRNIKLKHYSQNDIGVVLKPVWVYDNQQRLQKSHRSALLFKNYEWYSQFGWKEEPKMEYWWPTKTVDI